MTGRIHATALTLAATGLLLTFSGCGAEQAASGTEKGGSMELRLSQVTGDPLTDVSGQKPGKPADVRRELSGQEVAARVERVYEKLGEEQVAAAEEIAESPLTASAAETALPDFAPWGDLSPDEVAVLPAAIQHHVPAIGCGQLNAREVKPAGEQQEPFTVCGADSGDKATKYLVEQAAVTNDDVAGAEARPPENGTGWTIEITFTEPGSRAWQELATAAVDKQVAIIVDGELISAPQVQADAAAGSAVVVTGKFNQQEAEAIAARIVP